MVSEAVLGAIVGGSAAVLGSVVQAWFNRQNTKDRIEADSENLQIRQQAETERRRGEYYIQQKVEALMRLYAVLEETRRAYKRTADQAAHTAITEEDYQEVVEWYDKHSQATDRAAVFLTEEQHETLLEVLDKIHRTNRFLHNQIDNERQQDYSEFGLGEYNQVFDAAENMLKEEIKGPIEAVKTD